MVLNLSRWTNDITVVHMTLFRTRRTFKRPPAGYALSMEWPGAWLRVHCDGVPRLLVSASGRCSARVRCVVNGLYSCSTCTKCVMGVISRCMILPDMC
jgi:hypothetical protein